jgi:hypothetical protein
MIDPSSHILVFLPSNAFYQTCDSDWAHRAQENCWRPAPRREIYVLSACAKVSGAATVIVALP